MKFRVLVSVLLLTVIIGMSAFTFGAEVTLKQASLYPPFTTYGKSMDMFSELVAKYSNSEIKVNVYHSGQLGRRDVVLQNMMGRGVDILIETLDPWEVYVPECYFQGMPYLFKDANHVRNFYDSNWFNENVKNKLQAKGVVVFPGQNYHWERGPFRVMVSKIPILSLEDVQGIKLRVYPAATYIKAWQAIGANTTSTEWGEVYLGLRQNLIEAVTSPMNLVRPMKFYEVAKYITRIDEFPQVLVFLMNKDPYDKLTPFQKKAILRANNEAADYYRQLNQEDLSRDLNYMIEKEGVTFIRTPVEAWGAKVKPLYDRLEQEGKIAKGFWDMVQSLRGD